MRHDQQTENALAAIMIESIRRGTFAETSQAN